MHRHKPAFKASSTPHPPIINKGTEVPKKGLKPTTSKDILNRSLHIPTRRKQSPHILRRVGEAHLLQLL